jgi:hypothetical protein
LADPDRARFRETHAREREAVPRTNGGGVHGVRATSLADLLVNEARL